MKTKFFLTLTAVFLFLARSNGQSLTQTDSSKMETISLAHSLFPNENHYTIKIGQQMEYVFESHPSVGKDFTCYISAADVLKFIERVSIQEEPKPDASEDEDGADDEMMKFVFKGVGEGTCILEVNEIFRDEVLREMFFEITVEK